MGNVASYPGLFVVGAQKSGTTTLYALLRQHPDLFLADRKESHFFNHDGALPDNLSGAKVWPIQTHAAYLDLFAQAGGRLCAEICPTYLVSEQAAMRIKAVRPDAKIVILLRDPVQRSFSAYRHMQASGAETAPDFSTALDRPERQPDWEWQSMGQYIAASTYAPQVARYLDTFGPDQVRVITFEALKRDPIAVANDVLDFAGLSPLAENISLGQTNKTQVINNKFASDLLINRRFGVKTLRKLLPRTLRGRIKERIVALMAQPPEKITSQTQAHLTAHFAPDRQELERLTGQSFADWGR